MSIPSAQPLITTVIPTYRRPAMLRRAIRSVLNQTFRDFRVCVYDNASGDETGAVVEEFQRQDPRVEYVCRPTNIGAFANFVGGANRVKTPFFSFLSDDDLMLPNLYEDALKGFQRYPQAGLSTLAVVHVRASGFVNVTLLGWPEGPLLPPDGGFRILRDCDPGLSALLIRREVWQEFGGFDERAEPSSEVDFQLRVAMQVPLVVSRKIGAILVLHSESATRKTELATVWPGWPPLRLLTDRLGRDISLPTAVKKQALAILSDRMKRVLVSQGIVRSASKHKWRDAERAADLLVQECRESRVSRIIREAVPIGQKVPGLPVLLRGLVRLRDAEKVLLNLRMRWRLRPYSRFLRASTATASSADWATL